MFNPLIVPFAACIPVNNSLTGPLGPFIKLVEGGIGGLLLAMVLLLMVIALLVGVVQAARGARLGTAISVVISIPCVIIIGIISIAVFEALLVRFNAMC